MFSGRDCVSIKDFAKEEILHILELAREMKATPPGPLLEGKLIASCFFEPSTRTRLSFEAAAKRLGASVITCADKESTSLKKGETLSDTIRVIDSYTDLVILRHPLEGAARLAAEVSDKPVINGGDGANEHPTQTLLDLFTILECHKKLEGLHIAFVGDLKYSRTYSSLALALRHFGARLYFVSPPALPVKEGLIRELQVSGTTFSCHERVEEVLEKIDILYMTRVQEERFTDKREYHLIKHAFRLTPELFIRAKGHMRVLSPGPRIDEIAIELDATPYAAYFEQAANGMFVRQALLALLLGKR